MNIKRKNEKWRGHQHTHSLTQTWHIQCNQKKKKKYLNLFFSQSQTEKPKTNVCMCLFTQVFIFQTNSTMMMMIMTKTTNIGKQKITRQDVKITTKIFFVLFCFEFWICRQLDGWMRYKFWPRIPICSVESLLFS